MKRAITVICALAAIGFCGCNNDDPDWGSMTEVERLIHSMDTPRQSVTEVLKSADIWEADMISMPKLDGTKYMCDVNILDGYRIERFHFNGNRANIYLGDWPLPYSRFVTIWHYYEEFGYEYDDAAKILLLTPLRSRYVNSEETLIFKILAYDEDKIMFERYWDNGVSSSVAEHDSDIIVIKKSDFNLDDLKDYADFDTYREDQERAKEAYEEYMNNLMQNHDGN